MTHGYEDARELNILDFGADPSGVSDSANAFTTATALLQGTNNQGRRLYLPPGVYLTSQTINLAGTFGVTVEGTGGLTGGALAGARVIYTGTTGPLVNGQNSFGLTLRGIQWMYNQSTFTGNVIDVRNVAGSDTTFFLLDQCYVGGFKTLIQNGATGLNLDKCNGSTIRNTNFAGNTIGIQGKASSSSYSNGIQIGPGCQFVNNVNSHIFNAGQGWSVQGSVFENLIGGPAAAIAHATGVGCNGLAVTGCWFGDVSTSGTQIQFTGTGLDIHGNYIGINTGVTGILIDGSNPSGLVIRGNMFDGSGGGTGINVTASGMTNADFTANAYNVGTDVTGTPGGTLSFGAIYNSYSGTTTAGGLLTFNHGCPFTPAGMVATPTANVGGMTQIQLQSVGATQATVAAWMPGGGVVNAGAIAFDAIFWA